MIENIHFKNIGYQASKVPNQIITYVKQGSFNELEEHLLNVCVPIFVKAFEWNQDKKFYLKEVYYNSEFEHTSGKLSFLLWIDILAESEFSWLVYNVLGERNIKTLLIDNLWQGTLFLFPSNLQYRLSNLNMSIIKGSIDYDNIN